MSVLINWWSISMASTLMIFILFTNSFHSNEIIKRNSILITSVMRQMLSVSQNLPKWLEDFPLTYPPRLLHWSLWFRLLDVACLKGEREVNMNITIFTGEWTEQQRDVNEATPMRGSNLLELLLCWICGIVAEAATTRASRRSKRVTRGQLATPWKIESDTSHKIWRHPDRYFPYSLV